jgi:putative exosortase-associated protein (TIGR04073 family)
MLGYGPVVVHIKNGGKNNVKKAIALSILMALAVSTIPAFADEMASSTGSNTLAQDSQKNVGTGARNVGTGWVEVMDRTHEEAAKGKNTGEHLTGVVAGGAIGVRKAIHRIGGGAIDLLTFWIPKKQPLVNPETARLE